MNIRLCIKISCSEKFRSQKIENIFLKNKNVESKENFNTTTVKRKNDAKKLHIFCEKKVFGSQQLVTKKTH